MITIKKITVFTKQLKAYNSNVKLKIHLFFSLTFFTIYNTDAQTCIELPELNGTPQLSSAPAGWSTWYGTPDIITGNGNYPTGIAANIFDVNENSTAGGEIVFLIINSANGLNTESITTSINNLTPGEEYSFSLEWQQATLDYTNFSNDFTGGKLGIYLDGSIHSIFQSNGNIEDNWQVATVNFTATSTSHLIGIKGELLNGSNRGAIAVDNSFCVTSPLPIDLESFKANTDNDNILLSWKTLSELNNDFFLIERSMNGETWETIYKQNGAGNSANQIEYSYIDKSPPKRTIYYRLKQVDFDGKYSFSEILSVNNNANRSELFFWPNPTYLQLTINGEIKENISILNSSGQLIEFKSKIISEDNNQITIDVSSFNSGLYYIKTLNYTQKFIKE